LKTQIVHEFMVYAAAVAVAASIVALALLIG